MRRSAIEDRVRPEDHLLASVAGTFDTDDAWAKEVERRLAEADAGAAFVRVEDAIARARRAIS